MAEKKNKVWNVLGIGLVIALILLGVYLLASGTALNLKATPPTRALVKLLIGSAIAPDAVADSGAPVIYNYNGNVTDVEWLYGEFGQVSWTRTEPHPDTNWVFRLVTLQGKCGPAALVVKVIDENERPLSGYAIVRYWPGAPVLPDFSDTTAKQWTALGIVGTTNSEGDVGFGMGSGDYYWPDREVGVTKVYVADFEGYGDLMSGLGMIAATEHCHIDPTFQRIPVEDPVTPTPTPGPTGTPGPGPAGGWDINFTIDGSITPKE